MAGKELKVLVSAVNTEGQTKVLNTFNSDIAVDQKNLTASLRSIVARFLFIPSVIGERESLTLGDNLVSLPRLGFQLVIF